MSHFSTKINGLSRGLEL